MDRLDELKNCLGRNFEKLQEKLMPYAKKYGRVAAKPVLELYYVLREDSTPAKDKAVIALALGYLLLPSDILPLRKFGIFGLLDDTLSVSVVYKKMQKNITPAVSFKVEMTLDKWFDGRSVEVVG
ncbi:MAG TPA: DUF1232 domain-containing protein [Candidatus Avibacteroides excrementipullorum]|jgi:uncharacterized membrane protein YkvA (DUF1232 family)|nr:DUF1232 domain-containing protein [Candidatus Avibacteroides excrementipullorum]